MIVFCKVCKIQLTNKLVELKDFSLLSETDNEDYIPQGYYLIGNAGFSNMDDNKIIINVQDLLNSKNHSNASRLNGCCGLDGCDGLNKVCINNHEIGTERSDCWMPHLVLLEPELCSCQLL